MTINKYIFHFLHFVYSEYINTFLVILGMKYVISGQCWWCYQTHSRCVCVCVNEMRQTRACSASCSSSILLARARLSICSKAFTFPRKVRLSGVFERVVGGGVVCWARLQGEAGLQGYRRWKRLAAGGSITADCAAGARVEAPGSCPDLKEHQLVSVMSSRHTSGEDNTDLRGFRDKWWRRAGVPLHLFARRLL